MGSIPGSRRTPGRGHGSPVQYSRRENPVDSGAWWAAVCKVAESQTRLKQLSAHRHTRPTSKYIVGTWSRATVTHTRACGGLVRSAVCSAEFVITLPLTLLSWSASPHKTKRIALLRCFLFNVLFPPQKSQYFASSIIII